ncbi:hypothetical protein IQ07DRAFT_679676 [Pyrenochaeta sp. DS3sAY3a]|nr:hypothetical protein IQ07DRAFT_679676 [Pyrenochaeta sp. DS3sAY3a]
MVSEAAVEPQPRQRRRIPACLRCRQRKTKCDNKVPACSNCERAGVTCDQAGSIDKARADELQNRVNILQNLLKTYAPHVTLDDSGHQQSTSNDPALAFGEHQDNDGSLASLHTDPSPRDGHEQSALQDLSYLRQNDVSQVAPLTHNTEQERTLEAGRVSVEPELAPDITTPAVSTSESRIGPEQPLAHDVGLLSLGNAGSDPKYLGPSSGVSFARLIYASAFQTQGLPASTSPGAGGHQGAADSVPCAPLPRAAQMHRFVDSYFEAFDHIYPFLGQDFVETLIEKKCKGSHVEQGNGDLDLALLFLVAALGARNLERWLDANLRSEGYLASAMAEVGRLQLHESLQGVQVMLLLVLASLWFPKGLNAWYLMATIIASCLDLGLQRRRAPSGDNSSPSLPSTSSVEDDIRSSIFWSAYSIERTLSTTLGRPLTLRDEAIDVEFPGETGTRYSSYPATVIPSPLHDLDFFNIQAHTSHMPSSSHTEAPPAKKARLSISVKPDYAASRFSFRFDRITAEIKLMLYRVVQLPSRFPWPTDLGRWQSEAYEACNSLLETARHILSSRRATLSQSRRALPTIELKYHQCVLLLFRPSPAFRTPTADALAICHMSALEVIKIHSEQLRSGDLLDTWLTAHMVFISGITIIYTAWVLPGISNRAAIPGAGTFTTLEKTITEALEEGIKECSNLLGYLGQTWTIAHDAKAKFDRLGDLTFDAMRNGTIPFAKHVETQVRPPVATRGTGATDADMGPRASSIPEGDNTWLGSGDAFILGDLLDPPDFFDQFGDISGSYDFGWMAEPANSL